MPRLTIYQLNKAHPSTHALFFRAHHVRSTIPADIRIRIRPSQNPFLHPLDHSRSLQFKSPSLHRLHTLCKSPSSRSHTSFSSKHHMHMSSRIPASHSDAALPLKQLVHDARGCFSNWLVGCGSSGGQLLGVCAGLMILVFS